MARPVALLLTLSVGVACSRRQRTGPASGGASARVLDRLVECVRRRGDRDAGARAFDADDSEFAGATPSFCSFAAGIMRNGRSGRQQPHEQGRPECLHLTGLEQALRRASKPPFLPCLLLDGRQHLAAVAGVDADAEDADAAATTLAGRARVHHRAIVRSLSGLHRRDGVTSCTCALPRSRRSASRSARARSAPHGLIRAPSPTPASTRRSGEMPPPVRRHPHLDARREAV